jgi:hypothetical protein
MSDESYREKTKNNKKTHDILVAVCLLVCLTALGLGAANMWLKAEENSWAAEDNTDSQASPLGKGIYGEKDEPGFANAAEQESDDNNAASESEDSGQENPGASSNSTNTPSGQGSSGSGGASQNSTAQNTGDTQGSNLTPPAQQLPSAPATITVSVYVDSSRATGYGYPACLASVTVVLNEGASVYDALCAAGVSVSGSRDYVRSIAGLAEFACGAGSGWIYFVNGNRPGYGSGSYILSGGESIVWAYTLDFGNDM